MKDRDVHRQIEILQQRVEQLQRWVAEDPSQLERMLPEILGQLKNVLQETRVREEEQRQRNEELAAKRQPKEALLESQSHLRLVNTIATGLTSGMSVQQLIEHTVNQMSGHFKTLRVAYAAIDEHGVLTMTYSVEPPGTPSLAGFVADLRSAPKYLNALQQRKPVMVEDIDRDVCWSPWAEAMVASGDRALLWAPLRPEEKSIGLLCFHSPEPRKWSQQEIATLTEIAECLSIALEDVLALEERERAAAALRESEDRYRSLVESSPDAIFVEQDGKLAYMNPAGSRLLGYDSISELDGHSIGDVFDARSEEAIETMMKMNRSHPHSHQQAKWIRKDGKLLDVEVTLIHTMYHGKPAIQGVARDITATKTLRRNAQRMERLAALGQLAATIAHEIRNPLGSISLNFQYLSDQLSIPEEYKDIVQDIRLGIQRIQGTIRGILNFARPGPPRLEKEDIHRVLDSSIHIVEDEFQKAGIVIVRNYQAAHSYLLIDADRMVEVFVNLFLNAKQAMPAGGKLIASTTSQTKSLAIHIEDTGTGIPAENLERIFDPLFTTRANGTGLGLVIVSRILEQHQGEIFVESKVGVGTKFTIRLSQAGQRGEGGEVSNSSISGP